MPYIYEKCTAGKTVRHSRYYSSRYGIPGIPRKKNRKPTTQQQAEVNLRQAEKKLTGILNAAFNEDDAHIVLDYRKEERPGTWEEMRRDINEFFRRIRKEQKKQGKALRYVHVMELGKKGARHHHIVTNAADAKVLRECWKKGRVHINPLDDTGQYRELASYLLKYSDGAVRRGELKKRWYSSRNLPKPEIVKKIILRRNFRAETHVPRGYYLDKGSVRDFRDIYGNRHFEYTVVRLEDTS